MAILQLSIRPSEHFIFVIFEPKIFKFWILIEDCIRINDTLKFFDSLSISSEIELGLGPSQIKIFFHHISFLFEDFRVDPLIYFGGSNH
jgi:hypothetical protein